jgi:glycosyltransferase involved in cell wall biosynthesis
MQRGAYEAMSWGTPIITSDWPLLRDTFPKGSIFVRNHAQDIARGVAVFMKQKELLRIEMQNLKAEREHEWHRWVRAMARKLELRAG